MTSPSPADARLVPYLPRLAIQWAAEDPGTSVRIEDGTLVFVDISGFTKMSERLARHGKVGAEEVTDVLGAVFTRLLAVAYAEGAGLLKFGGDALLLWFPGDDHVARAARAAHGMRATLRGIGALDTTAGKVTLRMSIGVNSGLFHFFLVGGSHGELIIAGPAATETVRMEAAAAAGEILVSEATATLLPGRIVGQAKGPGRLLRSAPPGISLEPSSTELPEVVPHLEPFIPVGLRESVLAGTEPEHRSATIAFVHFDGTDELIEHEGSKAAATALDELVRDVQEAVDAQGVCFLASDIDADGGKLILTAGVPRMVGDDEERMLLALRQIVERERRLPVRVGVNRGPIFSGDVGPAYRRTYTVMGDPVNLAARLMAKAAPGQIISSAPVLERSATQFETNELEPFIVKGKAKPVQAWSVGPRIGRPRQAAAQEYPLQGREGELLLLGNALDLARAGRRRTIVMRGEAGLGKTRLLDAVLRQGGDFEVFGATGEAFTSTTPYVAWRDVLRELIGVGWDDPSEVVAGRLRALVEVHDPTLLPWLPLIATAAGADASPTPEVEALGAEYRRPRLNQAVIGLLRAIRTTPTLLTFEDSQQMDEASADLLQAIATDERDDRPWLILALRRPEGDGFAPPTGPAVNVHDLRPLTPEATRALAVLATEEAPLPEHLLIETIERSGGNPQLLLDLILAARSGEGSLPDSVEAAATVRIDSLTPHDRQLVRRVSVFGLAFHPRFLADVLDAGAPMPSEATWKRLAEFFEPEAGGYLRFRRAVIRDAAYAGMPFRTRQRLHVAVGSHFEREAADPTELAGLLSLHYSLGAEHERAWQYARIAADRAAAIFANVEAARLYERAIGAARHLAGIDATEIAAAHEALSDAWYRVGDFGRAAAALTAARAHVRGNALSEARLLLRRSNIAGSTGKYTQSLRWAARGLNVLRGATGVEAGRLEAQLLAVYATGLFAEGRPTLAIQWADRAVAAAERSDDREALAKAYNVLDLAGISVGSYSGGRYWRQALAIHEERGDLIGQSMVLSNLGIGAHYEGRWSDALEYFERCSDVAAKAGDIVGQTLAADNGAQFLSDRGLYDEAEAILRNSLRIWRSMQHHEFLGLCLGLLGRNCARTGRFDEALGLLAEARTELEFVGASEAVADTDAKTAECHALRRDPAEALSVTSRGLTFAGSLESDAAIPLLQLVRGYALAQLGRLEEAIDALETSLRAARAREGGSHFDTFLALIAQIRLSAVARTAASPALVHEADELAGRLGLVCVPVVPLSTDERERERRGQ